MPKITQVIVSDELRGNGKPGSPYQRVPQLFTLDGRMICESRLSDDLEGSTIPSVNYEVLQNLR